MRFWYKALSIVWKDTVSELRTKEIIFSVLVFTLLVVVIFNFAFSGSQDRIETMASGILWVTFTFAGVLSLGRLFVTEKEHGCLEGLMICPIGREVIFVGKMLTILIFMLIIEGISLPIFALLNNLSVFSFQLIVIIFLTTVGFAAVGTLFSALSVNTKAREMVLPILFLPIVIPLLVSAVRASEQALSGESWSNMSTSLQIIGAFDVIFVVVTFLIFSFVIEE